MRSRSVALVCCVVLLLLVVAYGADAACGASDRPLRVVLHDSPAGFDPQLDPTAVGASIFGNIFSTLVAMDAKGRETPGLAFRWESKGNTTWRFELRRGVVFHSGAPFSSEDAVASILRARDNLESNARAMLSTVTQVVAEGPLAFRIELCQPDSAFLIKLSTVFIVPKDSPNRIEKPIGTGPYQFIEAKPGVSITLRAFDRYWGEKPKEKDVELLISSDEQVEVKRLIANEVDMVMSLHPQVAKSIEGNNDVWVDSSLGSSVFVLILNTNQPPFDNPLLREAIDYALDRKSIASEVFLNYARPVGQLVASHVVGYATGLEPINRDLVRAKSLMKTVSPSGEVSFALEFKQGNEAFAAAIQKQLGEIGLHVQLKPMAWSEVLPRILSGKVQAAMYRWRTTPPDVGVAFGQLVHSSSPNTPKVGIASPETDRLIENCDVTSDPQSRQALLQKVAERLAGKRALIPMVWLMDLYGSRRTLKWTPSPSAEIKLSTFVRTDS